MARQPPPNNKYQLEILKLFSKLVFIYIPIVKIQGLLSEMSPQCTMNLLGCSIEILKMIPLKIKFIYFIS